MNSWSLHVLGDVSPIQVIESRGMNDKVLLDKENARSELQSRKHWRFLCSW